MIRLAFGIGGALRQVTINKRIISLMTKETGYVPIQMDLDKMNEKSIKKQMGKDGLKFMKEISHLKNEEDMAKDIIKDFQETGWRLVKKE